MDGESSRDPKNELDSCVGHGRDNRLGYVHFTVEQWLCVSSFPRGWCPHDHSPFLPHTTRS